jgi:hypothetical protein
MHPNEVVIRRFYQAFAQKDYQTMQQAYGDDATFTDPVFRNLSAREVKSMWKMLVTSASDLEISFNGITADDLRGHCRWEARYTFSATGRKVHNTITADFHFKDGLIFSHEDRFNFWRWSRMALGAPGLLLGWTPYLVNAVRTKVKRRLERFMNEEARKD